MENEKHSFNCSDGSKLTFRNKSDMNPFKYFDVQHIDGVGYCLQLIVTLTFLATTSSTFTDACFAILPLAICTLFLEEEARGIV
jgi:hypothetical protein